jgi:hypothetical protein
MSEFRRIQISEKDLQATGELIKPISKSFELGLDIANDPEYQSRYFSSVNSLRRSTVLPSTTAAFEDALDVANGTSNYLEYTYGDRISGFQDVVHAVNTALLNKLDRQI